MVFIHFDGVVISSKYDRIVLAANNQPIWMANHGTTNIIADSAGESNCFSHTRHYPVTAGPQSFYAIAHNFVTLEGTGIIDVSIYGRLTVEYIPQSAGVISAHSHQILLTNVDYFLLHMIVSPSRPLAGESRGPAQWIRIHEFR